MSRAGGSDGPHNPSTDEPGPETPPGLSAPTGPQNPEPARPKVEVATRRLPASFYFGLGLAAVGVVVMVLASRRVSP